MNKAILSLSILIVALSVAYYFVIFLPSKEQQKQVETISISTRNKEKADALSECTNTLAPALVEFAKDNPRASIEDFTKTKDLFMELCMQKKGFSIK